MTPQGQVQADLAVVALFLVTAARPTCQQVVLLLNLDNLKLVAVVH